MQTAAAVNMLDDTQTFEDLTNEVEQKVFSQKLAPFAEHLNSLLVHGKQIDVYVTPTESHMSVFVSVYERDGKCTGGTLFDCGWEEAQGVAADVLETIPCAYGFGAEEIFARSPF
jgi:hypothetical protein